MAHCEKRLFYCWSFANPAKIPVSIVYKASRGLAGQIEAD
jgi:hypothetical protein